MEDLKKLSNSELLKSIEILSNNHEQVKQELIALHEILIRIEEEYVNVTTELANRK